MADKRIDQLVAATTVGDDDLLVLQQNNQAKKLSGKKLGDYVYAAAAGKITEVEQAVADAQNAVDSLEEQKNEIAETIASMAELGTDTTLSTPGMAADAAATGEVKDIVNASFDQAEITGVPVATFDDGADNVPVKKLVVNIKPVQSGSGDPSPTNIRTISGWTGVNVTRTGKNLCGKEALRNEFLKINGATDHPTDRYVTFSAVAANKSILTKMYKENTRYTFIFTISKTIGTGSNLRIYYTDGTYTIISGTSTINQKQATVTVSSSGKTVRAIVNVNSSGGTSIYYDESGIFEGVLTADDFESYVGTTYPITFPSEAGTVYGGTLDMTNGVLTVDTAYVDLGTLAWSYINTTVGQECFTTLDVNTSIKLPSASTVLSNVVCSQYKEVASSGMYNYDKIIAVYTNGAIGIRDTTYTDATTFTSAMSGVQFVYPIRTPVVYQLTPIEVKTLLGLNNIWADTGNINELIYRKMQTPTNEIYNTLESMIAGVEETMEASQNYTAGKLVIAVHKLYHISSNIASGETLVPGTNCYITTIANELSDAVGYIDTQFALLGNVATLTYQVVT